MYSSSNTCWILKSQNEVAQNYLTEKLLFEQQETQMANKQNILHSQESYLNQTQYIVFEQPPLSFIESTQDTKWTSLLFTQEDKKPWSPSQNLMALAHLHKHYQRVRKISPRIYQYIIHQASIEVNQQIVQNQNSQHDNILIISQNKCKQQEELLCQTMDRQLQDKLTRLIKSNQQEKEKKQNRPKLKILTKKIYLDDLQENILRFHQQDWTLNIPLLFKPITQENSLKETLLLSTPEKQKKSMGSSTASSSKSKESKKSDKTKIDMFRSDDYFLKTSFFDEDLEESKQEDPPTSTQSILCLEIN